MRNLIQDSIDSETAGFGVPKCSTGIEIPQLVEDPCGGSAISTECVKDPTAYLELGLPENSSQKEINQALYLNATSQEPQVNTDWDVLNGPAALLNRPNFKTINGEAIIGTGNIEVSTGGGGSQPKLLNADAVGDGITTTFYFSHGLGYTPSSVLATGNTMGTCFKTGYYQYSNFYAYATATHIVISYEGLYYYGDAPEDGVILKWTILCK